MEARFRDLLGLAFNLPVRIVTKSLSLRDDRIDPESAVEDLTAEIEDVYGAQLNVEEVLALNTAGDLWDLVQQRRSGREV